PLARGSVGGLPPVVGPQDAPPVRWGILGAGGLAQKMTDAITNHTASVVAAVASRTPGKAEAFAAAHGIEHAHASYEELLARDDIDAVYIATTHNDHDGPALLAIEAGKPALVEKAFTQNSGQARTGLDAAKAKGVYVQEAMWTRWLPHVVALRETLARGDIGEIISVQGDHGQQLTHIPRLMLPELTGGALLDLGVYPIAFTHDILGVPESITAVGQMTESGVDGQVGMVLNYGARAQATLSTTLWSTTPCTAVIAGTEGRIEVASMFYTPTTWKLTRKDGVSWEYDGRVPNGFQYEAAELARRVSA